ncbi:hypothetical protein D3C80_1959890 [compost metagenome]
MQVMAQHRLLNRLRVDVHNGLRFALIALPAARAHPGGDLQAPAQWHGQKQLLD